MPPQAERRRSMVTGEVISFRKEYRMNTFPIVVQLYQCGEAGGSCRRTTQIIHSAHELREFQDELTRRESVGEWIFIAYYESNGTEEPAALRWSQREG
jgi:hypothetical protein